MTRTSEPPSETFPTSGTSPAASPAAPVGLRQNLDRGDRRHARRLHGGAEHPDRQRLARRHPGRDRRRDRRRRLDLDLLSDRRDRGDPALRLARARVLGAHLSAHQCRPVPGVLRGLRLRAGPAADDRAPRRAGLHRRRADPDGVHADHHAAAEGQAADRARAVCPLRDLRAGDRPDHRRLSHREFRLGVHLLCQHRAGRDHDRHAVCLAGSRADEPVAAARRRLAGHRHHGDRALRAADRAGGRQQGRLVRLALHRPPRGHRGGRADPVRHHRADQQQAAVEPAAAGPPQFRLRPARQLPARRRAVRLGLHPAGLSRAHPGLQFRADRHGAGLDRPAAARADPAGAAADAAVRRRASSSASALRCSRAPTS